MRNKKLIKFIHDYPSDAIFKWTSHILRPKNYVNYRDRKLGWYQAEEAVILMSQFLTEMEN